MRSLSISSVSSRHSSDSNKSLDRFQLGIRRDKYRAPKFSGKGNVMARMKIFEPKQKQMNYFPAQSQRQIISSACLQTLKFEKEPANNVYMDECFKLKEQYECILPQITDWSQNNIIAIGNKKGIEVSNFAQYYKAINFNQNWNTRCLQFRNSQTLGVGSNTGHVILFDITMNSIIRKIVEKDVNCSNLMSLIWDKDLLIKGSERFIKGIDTLAKDGRQFELPKHKNDSICTMSLESKILAVGYQCGILSLYDLRTLKLLNDFRFREESVGSFAQWCPWKRNNIMFGRGNSICQIQCSNFEIVRQHKVEEGMTGLKCLPLSEQIVSSSEFHGVVVRNKKLQIQDRLEGQGLPAPINCLGVSVAHNTVYATTVLQRGYAWFLPFSQVEKATNIHDKFGEMILR